MKKLLYSLLLLTPLGAYAQNYNPFVSAGIISPAPLPSLQSNGTGSLSFFVGNSGSDDLPNTVGAKLIVNIVLSKGEPNNADPIAALGGTFKPMFDWTYTAATKTYVGTQNQVIPGGLSAGSITVAYKVTINSAITAPTNGFTASLTIPAYATTSNAGGDDLVSSFTWTTFKISGTVFNDVNGQRDNAINGVGANPGGMTAYLVDTVGNTVATSVIAANGTYAFSGVNPKYYTVRITTAVGAVGSPAPAVAIPANWIIMAEGTTPTGDGTPNAITASPVVLSDVSGVNFSLEQAPFANTNSAPIQPNPGGTINVNVPPATFGGTDPAPGVIDSIIVTSFPSNATTITILGTTYTSGTFPAGGVKIVAPAGLPGVGVVTVDPVSGAVTVAIPYRTIDNAGIQSVALGTANVPFSNVTIAGNVFNDVNGMKDNTINGTGTNAGGGLSVLLVNAANQIVQTQVLGSGGAFSFGGLEPGNFTVRLSTTPGTVGSAPPAVSLPTNWVNTAEGLTATGDGTVDGIISLTLTTAGLTGANFGIEQRPFANTTTATPMLNPGGTNSVTVPTATFGGTDPAPGTVDSIRFTTMPTNATSLTIGLTTYTTLPPGGVTIFAPGGVPSMVIKVDPVNNAANTDTLSVSIPYFTVDNAGVLSQLPGAAIMRFVVPDLTPNISAQPSIMNGTTNFYLTVNVTELYKVATAGTITVFMPRDPRLTFTYDNTMTMAGFTPVQNAVWSFDNSNPAFYIFTTTSSIPALGSSTFGMLATFTPGNTNGQYTLTSSILSGSGSEVKTSNNNDAESIDYFSN
jgi:hypothetical protein